MVVSRATSPSRSKISEIVRRQYSAAVSAVIVAIHNQTRVHEIFDQAKVPSEVLTDSMSDPNDTLY